MIYYDLEWTYFLLLSLDVLTDEKLLLDFELEVLNENPVVVLLISSLAELSLTKLSFGFEDDVEVVALPKVKVLDEPLTAEPNGWPKPKPEVVLKVELFDCPKVIADELFVEPNVIIDEEEPNVNFDGSFGLSETFLFGFGSSQQTHLSSVFLFLASQTLHFHSSAARVGLVIPAAAQLNPFNVGLSSLLVSDDLLSVLVSAGLPKVIVELPEDEPKVNFGGSFGLSEDFLFGFGSSQQTHLSSVFLFLASQTLHFHSSAARVGLVIPAAAQLNPFNVGLSSLLVSDDLLSVLVSAGLPKVIVELPEDEPKVNFGSSFGLSEDFLFGFGSSQQTHLSSVFLFLTSQTLHFHSSAAKVGFAIPAAAQLNPNVVDFKDESFLPILALGFSPSSDP